MNCLGIIWIISYNFLKNEIFLAFVEGYFSV